MTNHAESEREEIACDVFDDIPPKAKLEAMSNLSLAKLQESFSTDKACLIIIQNEWRRREKIEQHKLNKDLVKAQNKTAIVASIFGIIGTIVGAILTVILTQVLK
jgi:hypothetical protein